MRYILFAALVYLLINFTKDNCDIPSLDNLIGRIYRIFDSDINVLKGHTQHGSREQISNLYSGIHVAIENHLEGFALTHNLNDSGKILREKYVNGNDINNGLFEMMSLKMTPEHLDETLVFFSSDAGKSYLNNQQYFNIYAKSLVYEIYANAIKTIVSDYNLKSSSLP